MAISLTSQPEEQHAEPWAALLDLFYSRAGLPLPLLEKREPEDIPQPYRGLLVHSQDMTPTLEGFYEQPLGLAVLSRTRVGSSYLREVVLTLAGSGKQVGYGVIRVVLEHLPSASASRVLEERVPFGSILEAEGIPHLSWPQAFFSVEPDRHMSGALGLKRHYSLYGRRNVLLDGSRRLLAEVIEVLAPVLIRNSGTHRRTGVLKNQL